MELTDTFIRSLPKVLLHDHLDGGLRPQTAIELARDQQLHGAADDRRRRPRASGFTAAPSEAACRSTSKGSRTPAA